MKNHNNKDRLMEQLQQLDDGLACYEELREQRCWVPFIKTRQTAKLPFNIRDGKAGIGHADVKRGPVGVTFSELYDGINEDKFQSIYNIAGFGVYLDDTVPYGVLDFDGVVLNDGTIHKEHQPWIQKLSDAGTRIFFSNSRRGYHVFFRKNGDSDTTEAKLNLKGEPAKGEKKPAIELFFKGRGVLLTGDPAPASGTLADFAGDAYVKDLMELAKPKGKFSRGRDGEAQGPSKEELSFIEQPEIKKQVDSFRSDPAGKLAEVLPLASNIPDWSKVMDGSLKKARAKDGRNVSTSRSGKSAFEFIAFTHLLLNDFSIEESLCLLRFVHNEQGNKSMGDDLLRESNLCSLVPKACASMDNAKQSPHEIIKKVLKIEDADIKIVRHSRDPDGEVNLIIGDRKASFAYKTLAKLSSFDLQLLRFGLSMPELPRLEKNEFKQALLDACEDVGDAWDRDRAECINNLVKHIGESGELSKIPDSEEHEEEARKIWVDGGPIFHKGYVVFTASWLGSCMKAEPRKVSFDLTNNEIEKVGRPTILGVRGRTVFRIDKEVLIESGLNEDHFKIGE